MYILYIFCIYFVYRFHPPPLDSITPVINSRYRVAIPMDIFMAIPEGPTDDRRPLSYRCITIAIPLAIPMAIPTGPTGESGDL